MGAWVGGWVGGWVGPGQIIKNRINLDLIEIIQFCLKIYDLLTHPDLWVDGWVNMWVNGDNMRTMCRQHGDNMGTTGMWKPHGDNVETTWDVGTTWTQHGMWRP